MNISKFGLPGIFGFLIAIPLVLWIGTNQPSAIGIVVVVCVFVSCLVWELLKYVRSKATPPPSDE